MHSPAARIVDLNHALDEGHWSAYQKRLLVLAALAFAVDGLANQVLGLAVPALIGAWHTPREAFAPVAALGLIGVALGTAIGGMLGDRFGRRAGLIGSVLLFGVMTACTAAVNGLAALMWLRLLAGLGIGGAIPNGAAIISEFTPLRQRSLALALGMLFIPVGGVLAGAIGTLALASLGWRELFLICGVLPVALALIFVVALPESPRYLARWPHRRADLIALLQRCGQGVGTDCEFREGESGKRRTPLKLLFARAIVGETLLLWVGFFFCLLASYTMFSWVPTMLMGQGFSLSMTSTGMTIFNIGGMLGGVTGGWMIGRFGSRLSVPALAAGSVLGALALGLLPIDPHRAPLALSALILEGVFIGGLHNGLYTLAAYIYPPFARATGVGAAAGVGRIGAVLSSYTGVITLKLAGASGYFIVIAAACGIAFLATALIRERIPRRAARALPGTEPVIAASAERD
jgi:MFS transporter, AAHS family, 4-hydroxybenzoate transporter